MLVNGIATLESLGNGIGNIKMQLEIGSGIWHWKTEMETLDNTIENIGKFK